MGESSSKLLEQEAASYVANPVAPFYGSVDELIDEMKQIVVKEDLSLMSSISTESVEKALNAMKERHETYQMLMPLCERTLRARERAEQSLKKEMAELVKIKMSMDGLFIELRLPIMTKVDTLRELFTSHYSEHIKSDSLRRLQMHCRELNRDLSSKPLASLWSMGLRPRGPIHIDLQYPADDGNTGTNEEGTLADK